MTQNRLENYVIYCPKNGRLTHIDLKLYTKSPPIMMCYYTHSRCYTNILWCYYTHVRDVVGSWITIPSVLRTGLLSKHHTNNRDLLYSSSLKTTVMVISGIINVAETSGFSIIQIT